MTNQTKEYTMIPVERLCAAAGSPFEVHGITIEDVRNAIVRGTYGEARDPYCNGGLVPVERDAVWHANRVAFLVTYGWEDAIHIDVGIPSMNYFPYPLTDGHHRLCAAMFRGDTEIRASVAGSLDYAYELFGVDCSLFDAPKKEVPPRAPEKLTETEIDILRHLRDDDQFEREDFLCIMVGCVVNQYKEKFSEGDKNQLQAKIVRALDGMSTFEYWIFKETGIRADTSDRWDKIVTRRKSLVIPYKDWGNICSLGRRAWVDRMIETGEIA